VLEITRAVSLSPWAGDVTFNAASPGATPSAQKKGSNPVPYGTEMHATRYQYGFALTPDKLREAQRAATALRALCSLGEVAGNHGRFLYDFSPESIVLRLTADPAPRILYAFRENENGTLSIDTIVERVAAGDIKPTELVIGGAIARQLSGVGLASDQDGRLFGRGALAGAIVCAGVLTASEEACKRLG
jgi:CRISPR-associated protein Cst2